MMGIAVEGIKFREGENVLFSTGKEKAIYRCASCDRAFQWDADCSWYGSIKDSENHNYRKLKFYCSDGCRVTVEGKVQS